MSLNTTINILVTGGCGFIGSNFINYAIQNRPNWNIINIDAMYYCASHSHIHTSVKNSDRYTFVEGNICNSSLIVSILTQYNITHVLHFAAQSHVQNSFADASVFITDNILGTQVLLESCRGYGNIKKFIHVSTDEVYGESIGDKKTETCILCPTNPYAASKAGAEFMAQSYLHSYGLPIIITRGNNVYGPNQHVEKLIPCFINKILHNKKMPIQGTGLAKRAFMFVSDTVSAFEVILDNGVIGEIYNIGCDDGSEYTVKEVATTLLSIIRGEQDDVDSHIEYIIDRPYNDMRYYISNNKLKELGWRQKVDFISGLTKLINHYSI